MRKQKSLKSSIEALYKTPQVFYDELSSDNRRLSIILPGLVMAGCEVDRENSTIRIFGGSILGNKLDYVFPWDKDYAPIQSKQTEGIFTLTMKKD